MNIIWGQKLAQIGTDMTTHHCVWQHAMATSLWCGAVSIGEGG